MIDVDGVKWVTIREDPIFGKTEEGELPDGRRVRRAPGGTLWIEMEPGRFRCTAFSGQRRQKVHSQLHDINEFQDGSSKWMTHEQKDRGDQPCIQDMACEEAAATWPRYYSDPKRGLFGPMPFRTRGEERDFCKTYGFQIRR